MVNLVALVLIVMTGAHQAAPVGEPLPAKQVQMTPQFSATQLTPQQKAWFAHAVDHILTGRDELEFSARDKPAASHPRIKHHRANSSE